MTDEITKLEEAANIVAFLCVLFDEDRDIMDRVMIMPPDYIVEKFYAYAQENKEVHQWLKHHLLREKIFSVYLQEWMLDKSSRIKEK